MKRVLEKGLLSMALHGYVHQDPLPPRSQDSVAIYPLSTGLAFAVADGAGGIPGGRAASRLVVDSLTVHLQQDLSILQSASAWCQFLGDLDVKSRDLPDIGESTAVTGAVINGRLVGAHVGDSEAWVFQGSAFKKITSRPSSRLGTGLAVPRPLDMDLGSDVLIVGTDGLFRHLRPDQIQRVIKDSAPATVCASLCVLARHGRSQIYDDISVVALFPGSEGSK